MHPASSYHHPISYFSSSSSSSTHTSSSSSSSSSPSPSSEHKDLLRSYYHSHQPNPLDPRLLNPSLPPALTPCSCLLCQRVRASPSLFLAPDRSRQLLIIMQGPPGSGKSTLAREIVEKAQTPAGGMVICSTDTYSLTKEGRYVWNAGMLEENHAKNLERVKAFLDEGRSVIVDNTNIQAWQPREYVRHAVRVGVQVEFVRASGRYNNVHGVPLEKVEQMRQSMEVLTMDSVLNALAPAERRGLKGEGGREVLREAGRIAAMQGQFISFAVGGGGGGRGRGRAESQEETLERALARLQFGK